MACTLSYSIYSHLRFLSPLTNHLRVILPVVRNAPQRVAIPDGALTCKGWDEWMQLHRLEPRKPMTEFLLVWRHAGKFGQHSYMANDRAMSVILDDVMEPGSTHFCNLTLVATPNCCNSKETEDVQEIIGYSTEVFPAYSEIRCRRVTVGFLPKLRKKFQLPYLILAGVGLGHHSDAFPSPTATFHWRGILS
jgi:hypothetical protein